MAHAQISIGPDDVEVTATTRRAAQLRCGLGRQ
jgi:hypothetical protein